MANGRGFNLFQVIDQADRLSRSPERIPQNKDIQAANEFFQEMFGYDVATGLFKDVTSPAEYLKRYKDMERNALELRLGDKMMGPIERQFQGPLFDWGSIGAGVSDILDKKRRDQVLNEVVDAQADATRVELDAIPDPKRKRYKATYEGLDPEDPEDKKVIEQRHRFEIWMNELRDLDKEEGLPMRTKSLQEWMFNR